MIAPSPKSEGGARKLLSYLGSTPSQTFWAHTDPTILVANSQADTSKYTALQKKSAVLIGKTAHIAQYLDRDTRPDFASTVMIPSLQTFLNNPSDVNGLVKKIEQPKKALFGQ